MVATSARDSLVAVESRRELAPELPSGQGLDDLAMGERRGSVLIGEGADDDRRGKVIGGLRQGEDLTQRRGRSRLRQIGHAPARTAVTALAGRLSWRLAQRGVTPRALRVLHRTLLMATDAAPLGAGVMKSLLESHPSAFGRAGESVTLAALVHGLVMAGRATIDDALVTFVVEGDEVARPTVGGDPVEVGLPSLEARRVLHPLDLSLRLGPVAAAAVLRRRALLLLTARSMTLEARAM
jgi:hypothetical protein